MLLTLPSLAPMQVAAADNRSVSFNSGWTFSLGDNSRASDPGFDDLAGESSIFLMTGPSRDVSVPTIPQARAAGLFLVA